MNPDVKTAIGRAIQHAQHEGTSEFTRSDLFERYMGEPYGDEQKGRSAFVSTDVSDVVEARLADVMDVFTSSENILEFTPVGPEDEEAAKQETDAVSHVFWQKNDGFMILYNWFKESFIQQNAYVESEWVEKERITIEEYDDLTPDELQQILGQLDGEYEFLELDGLDENNQPQIQGVDPQTGQPQFAPIHAKIRCKKIDKRYEITCFPQEEFFSTARWHSLSLEGIPVCGRRRDMEKGELRAMGFSEESIDTATEEEFDHMDETRNDTRDHYEDGYEEEAEDSTKLVTVYKAYVKADMDGDGKPELLKVWAIGDGSTIMKWEDGSDAIEEVSHRPFSCLTPCPIPHRHVGRSEAEQVDDIARVKTVLYRNTLDNVYNTVYGRMSYDENRAGPHLLTDLLNPAPGAPVRTGGAELFPVPTGDVSPITLPLIEQFDRLKETRTGVTRLNQGLNSESLNRHSEQTVQAVMSAGDKRSMLVARILAETGLRDLFLRIHRDLRNGPLKEMVMKLRNEWVPVNPRVWRDRTDMTVAVGMGSGSRDMTRTGLMLMKQGQAELLASGDPILMQMAAPKNVYNTAERLAETFGFKSIDPFLTNPDEIQPPQPQPDPAQEAMQFQMQLAQAEMQGKQQEREQKFAIEREKIQLEHQRKLQELQIRMEAEERQRMAAQGRIQTDQERLDLDQYKAVMEDDRVRDVEEMKAATGYMRDQAKAMQTSPPVDYGRVTRGA